MNGEKVATFTGGVGADGKVTAVPSRESFVAAQPGAVIQRAADPNIVVSPTTHPDFDLIWPVLIDPTEVWPMCSEVSLSQVIPDEDWPLKTYMWAEVDEMVLKSGTFQNYLAFADGDCPPEYKDSTTEKTIALKNIGVYKSETLSDIIHAAAVASQPLGGLRTMMQPFLNQNTTPGTQFNSPQEMLMETVAGLKERDIRVGTALVLNGEDYLLAKGDSNQNPLVFDGIETQVTQTKGAHVNTNISGTFSAVEFDRFLQEACVPPDIIMGHPSALQEISSGYFQLGFQGSQVVNVADGNRITPGFNFSNVINTAVGPIQMVADKNFTRIDMGGGTFQSPVFPLRMTYNGVRLIERRTQIPLSMMDLVPGCTSIQFQIIKKTVLVIKAICAQSRYTAKFTGRIVTTCPVIGVPT